MEQKGATDFRPRRKALSAGTERMPSEKTPLVEKLTAQLRGCDTITDLFKLANSDDFRSQSHTLEEDELTSLRAAYRAQQTQLDGKCKLDQFDGKILLVTDVDWWHSETYNNDGVSLRYSPEDDPSKSYKSLTSSTPIVRFFDRLGFIPTKETPVRVLVKLEPVNDAKRAAQGQRIWSIKRLPHAADRSELPF